MAKLSAWLITIIGIFLVIPLIWTLDASMMLINNWIITVLVLVLGISKLMRNYKSKK